MMISSRKIRRQTDIIINEKHNSPRKSNTSYDQYKYYTHIYPCNNNGGTHLQLKKNVILCVKLYF